MFGIFTETKSMRFNTVSLDLYHSVKALLKFV